MKEINWSELWLTRWNQKIDESLFNLANIQAQKSWDIVDFNLYNKTSPSDWSDITESLLLKSSHLRAQGERQKSSAMIAKVYRHYLKSNQSIIFRLAFELGLDHFISECYNEALDFFLVAEQKAKTIAEKIFTLSNLLWCLEALDLKRERYEDLLDALVKSTDWQNLDSIKHVIQQINAYKLRKLFYAGEYKPNEDSLKENHLTQAIFFELLIGSLPYMADSKKLCPESLASFFGSTYFWQNSYRFRTLSGLLIPSDRHQIRIADAIDRLYLWTWSLLDEQKNMSLDKIKITLFSILDNLEFSKLGIENKLLLRNSVKWLSLFVPKLTAGLEGIYDFCLTETSFVLLEKEYLYINALQSNDFSFVVSDYDFSQVSRKVGLISSYISSRDEKAKKINKSDFEVDIGKGIVFDVKNQKEIKSDGLSRLFYFLSESRVIPVSKLGEEYLENRRKLYNLVSRAKKILSEFKIEIHPSEIHVSGGRSLVILTEGVALAFARGKEVSKEQRIQKAELRSSIQIPVEATRLVFDKGFRRQDLEQSYKVSKSSVNRILNNWLKENIVKKVNSGKATKYLWSDL